MKRILIIATVMLGVLGFSSLPVYADEDEDSAPQDSAIYGDVCSDKTIDKELRLQAGCKEERELSNVATDVINTVISIVGIVAVAVMIIGGVQFVTSTGDPAKVKKAKDTIIYGLIGLVVVILAWAIVSFIVSRIPTA